MEIPKIHEGRIPFLPDFCGSTDRSPPRSLQRLCQEQLGWKRTTTYTVIKRLGERGVLKK